MSDNVPCITIGGTLAQSPRSATVGLGDVTQIDEPAL